MGRPGPWPRVSPAAGRSRHGPTTLERAPATSPGRARASSGLLPLPGEHGFRFFPGFYRHVVHTMGRIPCGRGSVAQNLVDTTELEIAPFDRPSYVLPAKFPWSSEDLKVDVFAVVAALSGQVGVAPDDGAFFATKMWEFLTSCEERRLVEYERINWWDFIEADSRSAAYQKYFGNGITRSLVAAKARRASTKTIGDIFMQIVFGILLPGVAADRLLNGPTSDVWINPWLRYLQDAGGPLPPERRRARRSAASRAFVRGATVAIGGARPRGDRRLLHRGSPRRADGGARVARPPAGGSVAGEPAARSPSTSSG